MANIDVMLSKVPEFTELFSDYFIENQFRQLIIDMPRDLRGTKSWSEIIHEPFFFFSECHFFFRNFFNFHISYNLKHFYLDLLKNLDTLN